MKNLILMVMLFLSGFSIAQNQLPTDVWGIRNTGFQGQTPLSHRVYLSRSSEELCHDMFEIADPSRYVRIPSSGDNIIGVGTDLNNLTNYTVLGSFTPQPRFGFYEAHQQHDGVDFETVARTRSGAYNDPAPCVNRVTEIRDVRFSVNGAGDEIIAFTYEASAPGRFRVWIEDAGNNNARVRVNGGTADHYERNGGTVDPVSLSLPRRQVGNAYVIKMAAVSDLDEVYSQEAPIVGGTRITNINSDRIEFITASNDLGPDVIWLDRFHRENRPSSRTRGRFKTGATKNWERAGGKIRKFTVEFGSTDLYTYEGVQVNAERGEQPNRSVRALNGATITFTWRNAGEPSKGDAWIGINWRLELPPGWRESGITNPQIRIYSNDGNLRTTTREGADDRDELLSGSYNFGGGNTWRYADNDWELGVGFNYNGRTYRIKLVDNVGHGEHNGGNRPTGSDRAGGMRNEIGGLITNEGHGGIRAEGGSRSGSINFNSGW